MNTRIKLMPSAYAREPKLKVKSHAESTTKKHKLVDKISEKF